MGMNRQTPPGPAPVRRRLPRVLGTAGLAALLALVLAACGGAATSSAPASGPGYAATDAAAVAPAGAEATCGTAAAAEAVKAVSAVARRIYALELQSAEVRADQLQVAGYEPLLAALASGDHAGVQAAVTTLVYSHTHIVRLRVTSGGAVLADVGGPYILAPVGGPLRYHGRTVGSYVLSVQDDSGYQKLEARYIGAPVLMRVDSHEIPVEGTLPASAGSLPYGGRTSYHGVPYDVYTFDAKAFPAGTLSISLLLSVPADSSSSCRAVDLAALAGVGEHVWHRFRTVGAPPSAFVHELSSLTGELVYVRAGSRQIAGSTSPGPHLRDSGSVRYHGVTYAISSFPQSAGSVHVRVYQLLAL